jgi:hypothetical protein
MQPGKIDYRVLVLDYGGRQRRSVGSYLSRAIFPISLAITVGLFVFGRFTSGSVIKNFSGSSNVQEWVLSFEIYCSLPIILTFALAAILVPGGWLLDDAGVVYFTENMVYRQTGEVGRISDWLLKYLKAIAGVTALYTYVSLFLQTNFTIQMGGFGSSALVDVIMEINVIALIAGFPFVGGIIYMMVAQLTVENNLPALKVKLYDRMEQLGIDTTPRQLRDIFPPESRNPVQFKNLLQNSREEFKNVSQDTDDGNTGGSD